jgi:coproporphyrinogen III oxidase-like Fe-S oxidoreductase
MFDATQSITAALGFPAYETSNHALAGQESRHNLIYWRCGDYAGIGPGAHGRLTLDGNRWATEAPRAPLLWLQQVEQRGHGESVRDALSDDEQDTETLMMGMRLREGVDLGRISQPRRDALSFNINALHEMGMVEIAENRLRTTDAGRPVLNAVLRQLLTV